MPAANAPPTVNAPTCTPEPSDEGGSVTCSATATDDGAGGAPTGCTVDYDDGGGALSGTVGGTNTAPTCTGPAHTYADDSADACSSGTCDVQVCITGAGALTGCESSVHVVDNVAPTISGFTITVPAGPACQGQTNNVSVSFTVSDPADEAHDPITGTITWGDSATTPITGRTISESHSYSAGTYSLTVIVDDGDGGTDDDGGSTGDTNSTNSLIVNYNMSGILQPINPGPPTSIFKYGSTIPVKVMITDCVGNPVPGLAPQVGTSMSSSLLPANPINETMSTSDADTTGVMRYSDGIYIYNFGTKHLADGNATYYMYVRGKNSGGSMVTNPAQVSSMFGVRTK